MISKGARLCIIKEDHQLVGHIAELNGSMGIGCDDVSTRLVYLSSVVYLYGEYVGLVGGGDPGVVGAAGEVVGRQRHVQIRVTIQWSDSKHHVRARR